MRSVFLTELRPVVNTKAFSAWNAINREQEKQKAIERFFKSAKKDQVLVEDFVAESDRDFNSDGFFQIRLVFKNVRFNNEVYDHISINLNRCPHCDGDWRNHVQLYREMINDNFLNNLTAFDSDGDTVHIGFKLPIDNSSKRRGMKRSEYIILKNLVTLAGVTLGGDPRFRSGFVQLGPRGKKWLKDITNTASSYPDITSLNSQIRLFSPNDGPVRHFFNCNYANKKSKQQLDEYFARQQLQNSSLSFDYELLGKKFSSQPKWQALSNSMGKIWKDKSNFNETDLTTYLMPEFAKLDEAVSLSDTFSLVEYNLR